MTAEIRVVSGARTGFVLQLAQEILVGRADEAGLRFDPQSDRAVSARHATIGIDAEGWFLRDEGSRNGTFLNGSRVSVARLADGDRITFGGNGPEVEFRTTQAAGANASAPDARPVRTATMASPAAGVAGAHQLATQNRWLRRTVFLLFFALFGAVGLAFWYGNRSRSEWVTERTSLLSRIDSVLAAGDATVRALADEREELADALDETRVEVERVRRAMENARGNDPAEVETLRRQLQAALASLQRQQLAASLDYAAIERKVRRAVAIIWVETADGSVVTGTAFAVAADATLMTTRHVLLDRAGRANPRRIAVKFADSDQVWPARVVRVSDTADLALLKVDAIDGGVIPAPAFNLRPDTLGSGTPVAWIGFPLGGETWPQVAGTRPLARPLGSVGVITALTKNGIEVQGYGAEGGSGSPVMDRDGRILAVLYGGVRTAGGQMLVAVPALEATRLLENRR